MKVDEAKAGGTVRKVLIGMVYDEVVLGRIAGQWNGGLFASPDANRIGSWCVKHWLRHGTALRRAGVLGRLQTWAENGATPEQVEATDRLLAAVLDERERNGKVVSEFLLDLAGRHFAEVGLRRKCEQVITRLDAGKVEEAEAFDQAAGSVKLGVEAELDPILEPRREDFDLQRLKDLIEFDDPALAKFFRGKLTRDALVCVLAGEKIGKSMVLLDLAVRAVERRLRVAYFQAGDLTDWQLMHRFYQRVAQHPLRSPTGEWPAVLKIPVKVTAGGEVAEVEHRERKFDGPLGWEAYRAAAERFVERTVKSKRRLLKVVVRPNVSLSVTDMEAKLQGWVRDGWVADVVVLDYADILAPPPGRLEVRDQINLIWTKLRSISQKLHCLLVTATQATRESYGKSTLDRRHVSEDKRKLSHVTAMFGLNVGPEERKRGLMRLNWQAVREADYSPYRHCHVAGCLAYSHPAICADYPEFGGRED